MADLSESLRSDLVLCFILGAADYMNGAPCTGEELIPLSLATPLYEMAAKAVAGSESLIAQLFPENPETVFHTIYTVGYEAGATIDQAVGPAPIYLN